MRTCVDRGGTFTDVVHVAEDGSLSVAKVPSDAAVVGELARGPLTFGTTVATNALLERTGVRTALLVTRGFRDLIRIGDMTRPALFDPDAAWPEPLCSAVFEVDGRLDADGLEIEPLSVPDIDLSTFDAAAIVLLNSHRNDAHERGLAEVLAERHPGLFIGRGARCSPELGYLARIETTLVDAAITPVLRASMTRDAIDPGSWAIRSDGSLVAAPDLSAADAVLSGPAGGVLAVAEIARMAGIEGAVGLDMGGTSTDVCLVDAQRLPRRDGDVRVAGVRLRRSVLEVETIAAGGGSILSNNGLQLRVGPRSAGANPGPQCYGRGGPPTLTDAALAEGLVDPGAFSPALDRQAVHLPGPAKAFLDVARDQMAAAVRRLATSRGVDLRERALVSYGGAAGQHAAWVAERLEIDTVLVHPCSPVLCAWGQSLARPGETAVRACWQPLVDIEPLQSTWEQLETELSQHGAVRRTASLRFAGTDHALEVEGSTIAALEAAFHAAHRERFGFVRSGALEVVNLRVRAWGLAVQPPAADPDPFGLGQGVVSGPTVIRTATTSIAVPEGWRASQRRGLLFLEHIHRTNPALPEIRTPLGVALWSSRFMSVAEQSGALLQRLARSVNIRERLDFSCAVFDGRGQLIANAPHIPVHLGAMGETVRDLLRQHPEPPPGQAWLCNDPGAGGSHLPDLTVVTAVEAGGERWFVASRGHHVDVGGITPGSMPPHSRHLAEEGFVARHVPLLYDGAVRPPEVLADSRHPEVVLADLEAQVAANAWAARALAELGPPALVSRWMAHLLDVADESVQRRLGTLQGGHSSDTLDGSALDLRLSRDGNRLVFDFRDSGPPHAGNLNAPSAVVRAAVLYALRVLVDEPIPLNEGALRQVDILLPSPSILAPPPHAAVAGGNVETSMRLVDLVLRATGSRAASQGTMNNLTLGGDGWSLYETIGGGTGASAHGPGADARQVHMTNTRATDPEVLEARAPIRLLEVSIRENSGGTGAHRGGHGLVRELELCAPAHAALLATRRDRGAPGLAGGNDGLPGVDQLGRGGQWKAWDGSFTALMAGDRIRIQTPGGGGYGS